MNSVLAEYQSKHPVYNDFRLACENLVKQVLQSDGVTVHTVQSRLKERKSLADKLERPGKSYKSLTDVTDVVGIRVITFFEDDVDRVGKVIEREFAIDTGRSIDKRKSWESDRFGYMSLHFVVGLNEHRSTLVEYSRFRDLKCELQVRSILQHTWAEIEHDLGYKASSNVPEAIRRRFSRLSGLLELADREFCGIRDELTRYLEEAKTELSRSPANLELDDVTIGPFVEEDLTVRELDATIAAAVSRVIVESRGTYRYVAQALRSVGLTNVGAVQAELRANKSLIAKVAEMLMKPTESGTAAKGVSLSYLYLLMLAQKTKNVKAMVDSFEKNFFFAAQDRESAAGRVLEAVATATKDEGTAVGAG